MECCRLLREHCNLLIVFFLFSPKCCVLFNGFGFVFAKQVFKLNFSSKTRTYLPICKIYLGECDIFPRARIESKGFMIRYLQPNQISWGTHLQPGHNRLTKLDWLYQKSWQSFFSLNFHFQISQSINQSVSQSVSQSVNQSVSQLVSQSINLDRAGRQVDIRQTVSRSIKAVYNELKCTRFGYQLKKVGRV